jgi:hypothetical protein
MINIIMMKKIGDNKPYTYEYVKSFIENTGYKLISTEYKNVKTNLKVLCDKNHLYESPFERFKKGHRCPYCNNNAKITIKTIKDFCFNIGYNLVEPITLKNSKSKFFVKCDNEHIYETSWNYLQNGLRCHFCNGGIKHTYEYIKEMIENEEGYILLSTEYKNAMSKIKIKCPIGHVYDVTYSNFYMGHRCPICNGGVSLTYDYIKNQLKEEGYTLLSTEYINNNTPLRIKCNKNHRFNMRYSDFQQGQRCPLCSYIDRKSKPEKEIVTFIKTIYNGSIIENDRTIVKNPITNRMLELDIYLPEINKAIEFNGSYWHSKEDVKQRDIEKIKQCKEKDIQLLIVTEKDWEQKKENCFNIIMNFLN